MFFGVGKIICVLLVMVEVSVIDGKIIMFEFCWIVVWVVVEWLVV